MLLLFLLMTCDPLMLMYGALIAYDLQCTIQSKPSNGSITAPPKEATLQPPSSGFANSFQPAAPIAPSTQGFGAPPGFAPQAANGGNAENSMPNSQTGFVSAHDFPPLHSFHDGTTIGNVEQPSFNAFEANAFGQAPTNGGSGALLHRCLTAMSQPGKPIVAAGMPLQTHICGMSDLSSHVMQDSLPAPPTPANRRLRL